MVKVLINRCFGGFQLPLVIAKELGVLVPKNCIWSDATGYIQDALTLNNLEMRYDPRIIAAVKKHPSACLTNNSKLKIVEIPDDVEWYIQENDGMEVVVEVSRRWF